MSFQLELSALEGSFCFFFFLDSKTSSHLRRSGCARLSGTLPYERQFSILHSHGPRSKVFRARGILVERYHGKDQVEDVNVGSGSSLDGSRLAQPYKVAAKVCRCTMIKIPNAQLLHADKETVVGGV